MQEKDIRRCKVCNDLKQRILVGKFDQKNKKFLDENGLTWNGNVCGSCNRERVKNVMRKTREERKLTP